MSTSIILPVVGMATNSVAGGLICVYGIDVSARIAVPVLITSYLLVGMAVWLALILYTLYFHRLLASGWPAPAQLPTLFLLIGPYGQTASGLLNLGTAAQSRNDFGGYNSGVFLTSMSASGVSAASTLIALLLLGLDIFLIIIALAGIVEGAMKRQLTYNMTWWYEAPILDYQLHAYILNQEYNFPTRYNYVGLLVARNRIGLANISGAYHRPVDHTPNHVFLELGIHDISCHIWRPTVQEAAQQCRGIWGEERLIHRLV